MRRDSLAVGCLLAIVGVAWLLICFKPIKVSALLDEGGSNWQLPAFAILAPGIASVLIGALLIVRGILGRKE